MKVDVKKGFVRVSLSFQVIVRLSEKDDCLVIYKRAIPSVTQLSYTVSFMSSKWMFSYRPLHMAQP